MQKAPTGARLKLSKGIAISAKTKPRAPRKDPVEIYCGPIRSIAYAIPQEFGTVDHAAHPYMRPAFDATRMIVAARFANGLWDQIMKAIEREERKAARAAAKMKA